MAAAKVIIPSYVGDTIDIQVDLLLNNIPGEDLTGAVAEAEWNTPTPYTPIVDVTHLDVPYIRVPIPSLATEAQVPGKYELYCRLTLPAGEVATVLDAIVDLRADPITV